MLSNAAIRPWYCFALALTACNPVKDVGVPTLPIPEKEADKPFVFIYVTPAYPGPTQRPKSGVLAAVWPDGTIVRATSEAEVGQSYVKGRLGAQQLADLRRTIGDCGILSAESGSVVLHAAAENLTVRWGDATKTWEHSPGFEGTSNSSATDQRITRVKNNVMSLKPEQVAPEPPGAWAGYPHAWYN